MAAQVATSLPGSSEALDRHRRALDVQRTVGWLASPVCVTGAAALMRFGFRWRIRDTARTRALYVRLLEEDPRPLLIAANHLTMADSALIGWALGSTWQHVVRYRGLPWNVPEQSRVESSWLWRVLAYLMKCAPVPRGGERQEVARVLDGLRHLLRRGEVVLMFPEGGRSRSGSIDRESVAQGVGRLIRELGDCRVLCVYLRGDRQHSWSHVPAVGDTFSVATRLVEPRTELSGVRASRDLASQVLDHLVEMEQAYWANRHSP
jgi:1-acyl-sn-glycerol-3-phosphate acyltransferase